MHVAVLTDNGASACGTLTVLQVLISYKEADPSLGLEPAEASIDLVQRLLIRPGTAQKMFLPSAATAFRTVLNSGSDQQRTIVPETALHLVDG